MGKYGCGASPPEGVEGGPCILDDSHAGKHRNMGGRRWAGYTPETLEAAAAQAETYAAQLPQVTAALELDEGPAPVDDAELLEAARKADPAAVRAADKAARLREATAKSKEAPVTDTGGARIERKAGRPPVWDWTVLRTKYIEGTPTEGGGFKWPTHPELVEEFGIPLNTLRARSAEEGWTQQRARFQAAYERHRLEERAKERAKAAAGLDDAALKAAETGLRLCSAKLLELAQRAQARRALTVGDGVPDSGIDAEEQRRLASAVELWHKIGLRAVGDPETHRIELTGANGRPIEVAAELRRDDPSRLTAVLAVFDRAGLGDVLAAQAAARHGGGDVVAGEVEARP